VTAPIHYTIQEIAKICKAKWISKNGLLCVLAYVSLDSRKISYSVFETPVEKLGAVETAGFLKAPPEIVFKTIVKSPL